MAKPGSITVSTTDNEKHGIYSLKLQAVYGSASESVTFTVEIIACESVLIDSESEIDVKFTLGLGE